MLSAEQAVHLKALLYSGKPTRGIVRNHTQDLYKNPSYESADANQFINFAYPIAPCQVNNKAFYLAALLFYTRINCFSAVDTCNKIITNMQQNWYIHVPRETQGSSNSNGAF